MLGGAVQAMSLGITIISKEYRNKTADFLLSKPASRARILTGKLAAVLVSLLFTNAVFLTVAVVSALIFKSGDFDMGVFVMISLSMLFVQLVFAAMGFLTATLFHKIRSVLSVSLSAVFTFFIISLVQALLKEDFVNFLTPFKYFDSKYIIANHSYEPRFVITAVLVIAACIGTGYALYIKRDVHSV
jgi:ABC-2 type transport system permease protein